MYIYYLGGLSFKKQKIEKNYDLQMDRIVPKNNFVQ